MNTHKKLLNMGFIKCYPHVKYRNSYDEPCKMVPDVYTNEIKVIDGKRTMVMIDVGGYNDGKKQRSSIISGRSFIK